MRLPDFYKLFRKHPIEHVEGVAESARARLDATDHSQRRRPIVPKPARPLPGAGRLALILQRIASDSSAIAEASPDELAVALKVVMATTGDPVAHAAESSGALLNALVVARINTMVGFSMRLYIAAASADGMPPKIWLRVGPHPDRILLPGNADDLSSRIQNGDLSRAAIRALAYALGVSAPRALLEFENMLGRPSVPLGAALLEMSTAASAMTELLSHYHMFGKHYAAFDARPTRVAATEESAQSSAEAAPSNTQLAAPGGGLRRQLARSG